MKLKKMIVGVTKTDIKNFLKLQNKINITDIFINDEIRLIGIVQFLGMNINIETNIYLAMTFLYGIGKVEVIDKKIKLVVK